MSFEETYQAEVLQSRRTRSQRAHFWAKITGFALMLTIAVTLRSEPEFRMAIIEAGMAGVMAVTGKVAPASPDRSNAPLLPQRVATSSQETSSSADSNNRVRARPRDAVPVNRFGAQSGEATQIPSILQPGAATAPPTAPTADPTGMANDLGRLLQNLNPGR